MRVLVVDDHTGTRQLLTRSLERASYGVKAVASSKKRSPLSASAPSTFSSSM